MFERTRSQCAASARSGTGSPASASLDNRRSLGRERPRGSSASSRRPATDASPPISWKASEGGPSSFTPALYSPEEMSSSPRLVLGLQALERIAPARPQRAQPRVDEVGGEAPADEEGPELAEPTLRLVRLPRLPEAPRDALEHVAFRALGQRFLQSGLGRRTTDALVPQLQAHAVASHARVGQAGPRQARREARVVEVALAPQPQERLLDRVVREAVAV